MRPRCQANWVLCHFLATCSSTFRSWIRRLGHGLDGWAFLPIETSSVSKAEWLGQLHAVFFDLDGIWWLHRTHELHIRLSHVYFPSQTHPEKLCRKFSGLFQVPWCGETRGSSFGTWQAISNPERLRPSFVVRLIRTNVLQVSRKLDVLDCCAISWQCLEHARSKTKIWVRRQLHTCVSKWNANTGHWHCAVNASKTMACSKIGIRSLWCSNTNMLGFSFCSKHTDQDVTRNGFSMLLEFRKISPSLGP